MKAYVTDGKLNSIGHGLAGEDRLSTVRLERVICQELFHVSDILEIIKKLMHALRLESLDQGIVHVRCNQVQVPDLNSFHGSLLHIISKAQIHVVAKEGKSFCKTDSD
jgi:hypothetical protein